MNDQPASHKASRRYPRGPAKGNVNGCLYLSQDGRKMANVRIGVTLPEYVVQKGKRIAARMGYRLSALFAAMLDELPDPMMLPVSPQVSRLHIKPPFQPCTVWLPTATTAKLTAICARTALSPAEFFQMLIERTPDPRVFMPAGKCRVEDDTP